MSRAPIQPPDAGPLTRRELLVGGVATATLALVAPAQAHDPTKPGPVPETKTERPMKKILVLGAGFGGLEAATGLAEVLTDGYEITLVDRSDSFFVGFSKLDVLFGRRTEAQVRYPYKNLRAANVRFVQAVIDAIDTDAKSVTTTKGAFAYDYLIVALGADLAIDATPGFRASGAHEFYSMAGVNRLKPVLENFKAGTLLLGILGAPYKCPPAPFEAACQLHELFVRKGVRDAIQLKVAIAGARPVPNPGVADGLEKALAERKIELLPNLPISSIDAVAKKAGAGAKAVPFDLFIGVPVHVPPAVVRASKLVEKGYITPNPLNLETHLPGVYAVGDVTKIPVGEHAVPKAGAFAEDAARTVVSDILLKEGKGDALVKFHAKGACYFELSDGQVARVDADFFGGEKPRQVFEAPTAAFVEDKKAFESTRRDRWFKPA